jgi:ABC-type glycerol-3-phosphate transport system substrate-binding protein
MSCSRTCARLTRKARRIGVLSLLLTGGLAVVAGCGSSGGSGSSSKQLSMWFFNVPAQDKYLAAGIDQYKSENPDVTVNFEDTAPPTGTGGLEDKLSAAFATGSAPDVIPVISTDAAEYIKDKVLSPVTDADAKLLGYSSVAALKASFQPGSVEPWIGSDGQLYAIPWQTSTLDLYCDNRPFQKAGIDLRTYKSLTWDQFIRLGQAAMKADPQYFKAHNLLKLPIFQDDTWAMQVLTAFEAQAGGGVLPSANGGIASEASQTAIQYMKKVSWDLGNPHLGPTIPGDLFTAFAAGQTTCALSGNFQQTLFMQSPPSPVLKHMVALPLPTIYPSKPGNVLWGWAFGVNSQLAADLKPAAWKLIRTTIDRPVTEVFQAGVMGPSDSSLASEPRLQSIVGIKTIVANNTGAQPIFETTAYPAIAHSLRGMLESVILNGASIGSAAKSAAPETGSLISQAKG